MAQKYTEGMIAPALIRSLNKYHCRIPNFFWGAYESDVLAMDRAGLWTDFEIKCTRPDFFKDFQKGLQNRLTAKEEATRKAYEIANYGRELVTHYPPTKHEMYGQTVEHKRWFPNYLVYVVPQGLIAPNEVPAYAGIWEFDSALRFSILRRKKKIHDRPMSENKLKTALTSLSYRLMDAAFELECARAEAKRRRDA